MNSKFIALIAAASLSLAATAQTTGTSTSTGTAAGTAAQPGTPNTNTMPLDQSRSTLNNNPNTANKLTAPNSNLNSNNLNSNNPSSNLNSNNLNNNNLNNTNRNTMDRNGNTVNCVNGTSSATTGAPPLTNNSGRIDTAPNVACNNGTQPGQVRP